MSSAGNQGFWTFIVILFVFAMILSALVPQRPDNSPIYTQDERAGRDRARAIMKREGLSDKDADRAADIIILQQRQSNR